MKILIGAALLASPFLCQAQKPDTTIEQGKAVFRSNCAFCHGLTGRGGRGPSLVSGKLTHGNGDAEIKLVLREGVAGTTMPSFDSDALPDDDVAALIAFIRNLEGAGAGGSGASITGDPAAGRAVYERSGCGNCHLIGKKGSVYGPELTRIGAGRSPEYLKEALLQPSHDIPEEYSGVSVILKDGRKVSGVRVNEDTFSVQLRDFSQNFRMFQKDEVKQVVHETKSMMPAYDKLAAKDLENLLAYLNTLRGDLAAGGETKKAKGIQ